MMMTIIIKMKKTQIVVTLPLNPKKITKTIRLIINNNVLILLLYKLHLKICLKIIIRKINKKIKLKNNKLT